LRFIEWFEDGTHGPFLAPYNDSANNATVGVGHLIHYGPVTVSDVRHYREYTGLHGRERPHPFNDTDAFQLLAADVGWVQNAIIAYVHGGLPQNVFDALADATFNCGPAILTGSVGDLASKRDYAGCGEALLAWDHSAGVVVEGLYARRVAERALILTGEYRVA
jgi:lysozyme